ncbi:MAG: site-2 protease family protein [Ignavibacteriaceae bacterium]|jgi:membrane-associated protease RseP (regulator of RpoE activity)
MPEYYNDTYERNEGDAVISKDKKNYILHTGLFILTFITCTFAGAQWISTQPGPYELSFLLKGLPYSISIMFIISCHEFGHYFAARYHKVKATLPFYIPFPPIPLFINFGTMGAVIKTKSAIYSKKAMFDIGIAGPLAGFIACLIVLFYGFTHVPGINYLLAIHPDFFSPNFGKNAIDLGFGNTLLFSFFKLIFIHGHEFFPPMSEIYHYPYLCVGWFGLFITAMNMIPIGQLDGGHVAYTMFGDLRHSKIAAFFLIALIALGTLGVTEATPGLVASLGWMGWLFLLIPLLFISRIIKEIKKIRFALFFLIIVIISIIILGSAEWVLKFSTNLGWIGWLIWAMLLFFVIKLKHPIVPDERELGSKRKFLGYLSFFILIISFSPTPFIV